MIRDILRVIIELASLFCGKIGLFTQLKNYWANKFLADFVVWQ